MPQIQFPGNDAILSKSFIRKAWAFRWFSTNAFDSAILDLFENKISGIFSQLDDECKMQLPKLENFMQQVTSTHGTSPFFTGIRTQDGNNGFVIQHFAQKVSYNTVMFG